MVDPIGDRMKSNYENRYRIKLTRRTPVIIRLDGKAFHTLTKQCAKPFDTAFQALMTRTTQKLCDEIQGAKCAYVQSDEISILLTDFDRLTTDSWFDYNLQKMVSVSAGIASATFTTYASLIHKQAIFDSRAFNIPKEEVCNYFIWRQQDWVRNSLQMLAQSHYSHKQLQNKNHTDLHEMLYKKGVNWADLESVWKNGLFLLKNTCQHINECVEDHGTWELREDIILTQHREFIEQYMEPREI